MKTEHIISTAIEGFHKLKVKLDNNVLRVYSDDGIQRSSKYQQPTLI
jgi:hypothetical protein